MLPSLLLSHVRMGNVPLPLLILMLLVCLEVWRHWSNDLSSIQVVRLDPWWICLDWDPMEVTHSLVILIVHLHPNITIVWTRDLQILRWHWLNFVLWMLMACQHHGNVLHKAVLCWKGSSTRDSTETSMDRNYNMSLRRVLVGRSVWQICPTGKKTHWQAVLESHTQCLWALQCMMHFSPFPQPKTWALWPWHWWSWASGL